MISDIMRDYRHVDGHSPLTTRAAVVRKDFFKGNAQPHFQPASDEMSHEIVEDNAEKVCTDIVHPAPVRKAEMESGTRNGDVTCALASARDSGFAGSVFDAQDTGVHLRPHSRFDAFAQPVG